MECSNRLYNIFATDNTLFMCLNLRHISVCNTGGTYLRFFRNSKASASELLENVSLLLIVVNGL